MISSATGLWPLERIFEPKLFSSKRTKGNQEIQNNFGFPNSIFLSDVRQDK